jgi:uroporphyrinogen-III decarboxylase
MVQLFESHAGSLDHNLFVKFALPYIRVISKRVRDQLKERNVPCVPMVSLIFSIFKSIFV